MEKPLIEHVADLGELVIRARELTLAAAREAVSTRGVFSMALSGGSTPLALYECMRESGFADTFPWKQAHFFWGDERFAPGDPSRSNYRAAIEELPLDLIPAANLHPVDVSQKTPERAAEAYEEQVAGFFKMPKGAFPSFDLVLLGLGEDGHTASLFKGDPSLDEKKRLAVAARSATGEPRVTLTLPLLNAARKLLFLVSGEAKAAALRAATRGEAPSPAALVRPSAGRVTWLVDEAAASLLQ